jgi:hypothetical protein
MVLKVDLSKLQMNTGTDAANLANYYAGMAYLNTAKYTEGLNILSKFKSEDVVLGALAKEQSEMLMHKISNQKRLLDNYLSSCGK